MIVNLISQKWQSDAMRTTNKNPFQTNKLQIANGIQWIQFVSFQQFLSLFASTIASERKLETWKLYNRSTQKNIKRIDLQFV